MRKTRIKISSIIQNQLPEFVKEEFPLVSEFLSQYYISLESKGHTSDILQNIDQYIKVDNLTNLIESGEAHLHTNNNQPSNKENLSLYFKIKRKIIIFCCVYADTIISYIIGLLICMFIFLYFYIKI
jgi:hypothetical protein